MHQSLIDRLGACLLPACYNWLLSSRRRIRSQNLIHRAQFTTLGQLPPPPPLADVCEMVQIYYAGHILLLTNYCYPPQIYHIIYSIIEHSQQA